MAPSSDKDRDLETPNETPSPPERKENPFIKFRQFADNHIGTLLQGIIGLPSALSSNSPGNTRWADFDDDLRRRDELQAKQRQLKEEEEARREEGRRNDTGTDTASTTSLARNQNDTLEPKHTSGMSSYFPHNVREGKDIPLFSPVTKALFAGLDTGEDESAAGWGLHNPLAPGNLCRPEYYPFHVLQSQKPSSDMDAVGLMVYNDLERSDTTLHSNYSILPYLLFSPYSPIRLKLEAAKEMKVNSNLADTFPYHAAFEDLIETTVNDEEDGVYNTEEIGIKFNATHQNYPFQDYRRPLRNQNLARHSFRTFNPDEFKGETSVGWMAWIRSIHGKGLLQEQEVRETRDLPFPWSPSSKVADLLPSVPARRSKADKEDESEDAETEHDMYQRFLHWASTSSEIAGALGALVNDPEGFVEKQLKAFDSPQGKRIVEELIESKFAKEVKDLVDMLEGFNRPGEDPQPSAAAPPKASQELVKVVSTSTTTEHTTHEDGTVETCVTVWKRYADGRESVTTTNHVDNPACDENGNQIASESTEGPVTGTEEKKNSERKGWFWN